MTLLLKGIAQIPKVQKWWSTIVRGNENSALEAVYGKFDPLKNMPKQYSIQEIKLLNRRAKADALAKANLEYRSRLAKKLLNLENESLAKAKAKAALDKANRALDYAGTIFDLDKIQLYAALQGRITEADRDKLTLKLLLLNAENQTGDALNRSAAEATALSQKILMQNGLVMTYDGLIKNLAVAKNPFEGFDAYTRAVLEQIMSIQLALNSLRMPSIIPFVGTPFGQAAGKPSTIAPSTVAPFVGTPFGQAGGNNGPINGNGSAAPFVGTPFGQAGGNGSGYIGTPFGQTTVNVNANWIASPQELQDAVQTAIQNANRSGNSINYAGGL